jgi:hypothetical protein
MLTPPAGAGELECEENIALRVLIGGYTWHHAYFTMDPNHPMGML